MKNLKKALVSAVFIFSTFSMASENEHKEDHESGHEKESATHDEAGHGDHEEKEENSQIGPDKGITEYHEEEGFKLSPEAIKNFEIVSVEIGQGEIVSLDEKAIVKTGLEQNVFRLRNNFFKRVDYTLVSHSAGKIQIKSKDLKPGDRIVVQGTGFLRISEISATGGAPEGHSH